MATIERLRVVMDMESTRLQQGLSRIRRGFFNVQTAVVTLAGAGGLGAMVRSQLQAADEMQKFAIRTGAGVEALSELRHAAELSGVENRALELSLQRMTRRLGEVSTTGKGTALPALEQLGLDAARLAQMAPEDQLNVIADALAGVENQGERVALAFKFFDSEGVKVLQMLEGGSAGLMEMREQARQLGLTLTRDQANAAARANDAMTALNATVEGLARTFALELAPSIAEGIEGLTRNLPNVIAATKTAFQTVGRFLGASAATVGAVLRGDFAGAAEIGSLTMDDIRAEVESSEEEKELQREANRTLERIADGVATPQPARAG